jgi:biotin operon repressor
MPKDATVRRQAQLARPDPLSFHDRPATAYAWDQMYRFQGKNPLVMLVYLAAAEDADRAIHIEHGYHCVTAAELATMLGLDEATIQPSIDYLVEQGLLVEVPAQLVFGFPTTGYRVSEAHFNPEER